MPRAHGRSGRAGVNIVWFDSVGPWRSWERASMASRRSWVRIPSAPPKCNVLPVIYSQEREHGSILYRSNATCGEETCIPQRQLIESLEESRPLARGTWNDTKRGRKPCAASARSNRGKIGRWWPGWWGRPGCDREGLGSNPIGSTKNAMSYQLYILKRESSNLFCNPAVSPLLIR